MDFAGSAIKSQQYHVTVWREDGHQRPRQFGPFGDFAVALRYVRRALGYTHATIEETTVREHRMRKKG